MVKRPVKELDLHEAHGPNDISPVALRECAETLDKHGMLFKMSFNESNDPKEESQRGTNPEKKEN